MDTRLKNTKRNIVFSYFELFSSLVFNFISRTIIINYLGDEYLGLSSLFTSILQVLSMAELGFSSAIIYSMYKPLARGDRNTTCALLLYYKKVYHIVGSTILICGTLLAPFVPHLIHGKVPEDINIYLLYFLYLLNTGISYFLFAYKSALLIAVQRLDLTRLSYFIVNFIQHILQIVVLVVFKNYYVFVIILISSTACKNILAAYFANKKYPQYQCKGELDKATKIDVLGRVKGLLLSSISSVTYTTFDSIILSATMGLTTVAIYNNYLLIFSSVSKMIIMIRNSMQASVGNSIASESPEKNYKDMLLWQFLFSIIATWCVALLLSLYQPFMTLWVGSNRLLPEIDVFFLCSWFFFSIVQHAFYLYLSGNGLWWEMRWTYILSTITNIVLNYLLGKAFGTTGIIFSTLFANFIYGYIWQCHLLFRSYFKFSMWHYQMKQLFYLLICIIACISAYMINQQIELEGVLGLLCKGAVCICVSSTIMYFGYFKMHIFTEAKTFIIRAIKEK